MALTSEYSFFPTSSSSLAQHSCVRLLWLPLSYCLRLAGEVPQPPSARYSVSTQSPRTSNASFGRDSVQASVGNTAGPSSLAALSEATVSGFEMKFRAAFNRHARVPIRKIRGAFPASCAYYNENATLHLMVSDDLGASQWENMEVHRAVQSVIVVLNVSHLTIDVRRAVQIVSTVLSGLFRGKVCRCFLVDAPEDVLDELRGSGASTFIPLRSCVPLEETTQQAAQEISFAIVTSFTQAIEACKNKSLAPSEMNSIRTAYDRPRADGSGLKPNVVVSRVVKKAGDMLLQLGAPAAALRMYGDTLFRSYGESLWCAATLESIAAARHQQMQTILSALPFWKLTLADLRSDALKWESSLLPTLQTIESALTQLVAQNKEACACLKAGSSVPNSMRSHLSKDIEDPLAAKMSELRVLLQRARRCVQEGTNELPDDPATFVVGPQLSDCASEMMRIAVSELLLYLNESLRQLQFAAKMSSSSSSSSSAAGASASAAAAFTEKLLTALKGRELETRLKILAFVAERHDAKQFLEDMKWTRSMFRDVYGEVEAPSLIKYLTLLALQCGCRRIAIAQLLELSRISRKTQAWSSAVEWLVQAAVLCGVPLEMPELFYGPLHNPLYEAAEAAAAAHGGNDKVSDQGHRLLQSRDLGTTPDSDGARSLMDTLIGPSSSLAQNKQPTDGGCPAGGRPDAQPSFIEVPILLSLLDVLRDAGVENGTQCRLATFLLFRYAAQLNRAQQVFLFQVASQDILNLPPHVDPSSTCRTPFLQNWEALALPAHLAPRTVWVGGPFFTFIDTSRLKLTVLCLNGKPLTSRVVWTVGDVCSVRVTLTNPFSVPVKLRTLSLLCTSLPSRDLGVDATGKAGERPAQNGGSGNPDGAEVSDVPVPVAYALSQVHLAANATENVVLRVRPETEGFLQVDGLELVMDLLPAPMPILSKLPQPIVVPVLQQLPRVACAVSVSELEMFSGQSADFSVRIVNCGLVPIERISLTAHSEQCLLEDCAGCLERLSDDSCLVTLSKTALQAAKSAPLQPGDVVMIPVHLQAPRRMPRAEAHFVVFRVDCSLPHAAPTMPDGIPPAVPVFGIIPRRVMETRMRLFYAESLAVRSVGLTKDRRFVDIRIANRSTRYNVELHLSQLGFGDLQDALIIAGAEYVVSPIEISCVPVDHASMVFAVPWTVKGIEDCTGLVDLDLSFLKGEVLVVEPLDECVVSVDFMQSIDTLADSGAASATGSESSALALQQDPSAPPVFRSWRSSKRRLHTEVSVSGKDTMIGAPQNSTSFFSGNDSAGNFSRRPQHRRVDSGAYPLPPPDIHWSNTAHSSCSTALTAVGENTSGLGSSDSHAYNGQVHAQHTWHGTGTSADVGDQTLTDATHALEDARGENAGPEAEASAPILLTAVKPTLLRVRVAANWRRAIPLDVDVSLEHHFDIGVLSGPVHSRHVIGDHAKVACELWFELFAFKTGEHVLFITIHDASNREVVHRVPFVVEHPRDV